MVMLPLFIVGPVALAIFLYGVSWDVRRWWRDHQDQARFLELVRQWREREQLEALWVLDAREPQR